jgi:hypothetical protein
MGSCAGTETSALFGCALLSSYLVLFINFYRITYQAKRAAARKQKQEKEDQQKSRPKSKKV